MPSRFFPINYFVQEHNKNVQIIIFAYNEAKEKIAIRFPYTYWFYARICDISYDMIRDALQSVTGVTIDRKENIKSLRSTKDHHEEYNVIRVFADTIEAKVQAIRMLANNRIQIHDHDNILSPVLKLMAEKNFVRYTWLECELQIAATKLTKFNLEFISDVNTLKVVNEAIAPPEFSIFSFDLETDTCNVNKVPDAKTSMENAIRVAGITFKSHNDYQEHVIVFGIDTARLYAKYLSNDNYTFYINDKLIDNSSSVFEDKLNELDKKYYDKYPNTVPIKLNYPNSKSGIKVFVHTYDTELGLINKLFKLIQETDPDIITGHNIINFDIPYLLDRYKMLRMSIATKSQKYITTEIPNISRLKEYKCPNITVEWNNSQVALSGFYPDTPGRIWLDTLVIAARGLFGNLKNNKLDTLAREILGMSKNDVSYKDMFTYFRLFNDYIQSLRPNAPFKSEDIESNINKYYKYAVNKHNKKHIPDLEASKDKIGLNTLNDLISLINVLQQRETKISIISLKESKKINLYDKYNELRLLCNKLIDKWNIPYEENISPKDKLAILWYLVNLYCMQDTRIPLQAIEKQKIVSVLREQSSVFSVDINDVLMRGQVFTVTNSQYRYNYSAGFMMDFGSQGGPIEPYDFEGGFVGKGKPGLKIDDDDSIIFSIDFASLYPTIIIAHNLCYTTWVPYHMRIPYIDNKSGVSMSNQNYIYNKYQNIILQNKLNYINELASISNKLELINKGELANDLKFSLTERKEKLDSFLLDIKSIEDAPFELKGEKMCNIYKIPNSHTNLINEHWYLKSSILPGVVPVMLWEQYCKRKAIKKRMEEAEKKKDIGMVITYNSQQLATKVSMNSTYGGFGTRTNRLANFAVAETVTYIGRTAIQTCNSTIESNNWGTVEYNDTDSAFAKLTKLQELYNKDMKKIKERAFWIAKQLSNLFPKPMGLEVENFFVGFFLKAPKLYAGLKYDGYSLNIGDYTADYVATMGLLYIKGLAPARRDKYQYNRDLFKQILHGILVRTEVSSLIYTLEHAIQQIWKLKDGFKNGKRIEDLFSYNMGISVKSLQGSEATMGQWIGIYEKKYGQKPSAGERFNLLVTQVDGPDKDKHTKSASKLVTLEWLLEERRQLDVIHYLDALGKDGNVVELMSIAYPNEVQRKCITKYYIPSLIQTGNI